MLLQQVENRRNYLENAMVSSWNDLTGCGKPINTAAMAGDGSLNPDALGPNGSGQTKTSC